MAEYSLGFVYQRSIKILPAALVLLAGNPYCA
jgi:hypothetical protein